MRASQSRVLAAAAVCVGLVLGLASTRSIAQGQRSVPGAIRVHVTLVPLNVVVTDKDDKPVTNLTKDDFVILENGVRQAISHFSLQTLTASAPAEADTRAQLRKVPTADLQPQTRRTFVIVLARGRLNRVTNSIDKLIAFVTKDLLPQDLVSVMAWNRATDFTTDHQKIADVLERVKRYGDGVEAKLGLRFSGLGAVYGSKDIPKNLQPDIDRIFIAPGAIASRHLPPGSVTDARQQKDDARQAVDGLMRMDADTGGGMSTLEQLQVDSLTDLSFDDYVSSNAQTAQDVQNIYTAVEYLRYMDGEKHLLLFTENGLFLPRLDNDHSLAAMANDARVTIDTFQTGGVDSSGLPSAADAGPSNLFAGGAGGGGARGGGRAGTGGGGGGRGSGNAQARTGNFSRMFALSSLRTIATLTGGRSSVHGDVGKALSMLNEVTRVEYLLGYYPGGGNWDGKYRNVTVRVKRPDLKVSYRRGYYARESLQPFDRKAFLTYSRIAGAGQYENEIHDLRLSAVARTVAPAAPVSSAQAAAPSGTPGGKQSISQETQIDLTIDAARIPFKEEGGLHTATLQITTFYGDARGRFLGDAWQTLELKLKPESYARVIKEGVPFTTRVPLAAEGQTYKIVVYSYDADLVGSITTKLKK